MNLYHLCFSVLIKHKIKVEKCYVSVNKLLDDYKKLEVQNLSPNLIEIKLYLNELDEKQIEDLIKKYFDNEEIVCIIFRYDCTFLNLISDRLKNKKKIILIVVQRNGLSLKNVNSKIIDKEI